MKCSDKNIETNLNDILQVQASMVCHTHVDGVEINSNVIPSAFDKDEQTSKFLRGLTI